MNAIGLRLQRQWENATWRDLAWLMGCALLFWASKGAGKLFEGVPGHAGAFWIPTLYLARAAVRRPGAASLTALTGAALWCFPKGGGATALAPYVVAGLSLDLLDRDGTRLQRLPFALLAGVLAHMAKFAFHNLPALLLGMPAGFLHWGLAPVAGLHVFFGLAGGFIGWLCLRAVERSTHAPRA